MRASTQLRNTAAAKCLPPTIRARLTPSTGSSSKEEGQETINGWLKSVRGHKNVLFAEVTDGSTSEGLQAVFKGDSRVPGLDAGASVRLRGRLVESRGAGQAKELVVDTAEVIGECDPEAYPIQKKYLPAPFLRDHAHLRFRTTQTASIMRIRDGMMRQWHDWFEEHEFIHIHTPLLTSSDCEGAGETFGIVAPGRPHPSDTSETSRLTLANAIPLDTDQTGSSRSMTESANASSSSSSSSFFPSPVNLTVSSQLHLEAPTHSLSRTYTLSPAFRAEPSLTSRHLCEFYMLEGEVVLDTLDELMDVVENGIRSVLTQMLGNGKRGEAFRRDLKRISEGDDGIEGLTHLESTSEKEFHRMTYSQAVKELTAQHQVTPFENEPDWNEGLPTEQEKWLAGTYGPTFITHYPKHLKPFYMLPSEADPSWSRSNSSASSSSASDVSSVASSETVSCFDLLFPHIGELAGGSMREHRLSELEKALDTHGLDKDRYGWYLDLRRYGSVPHGGWGMGWDRWISWVTGVGNLKDVVAYPRWKGHCNY